MRKKNTQGESLEKQVKRNLPDYYYIERPQGIMRADIEAFLAKEYDKVCSLIRDNYHTQLYILLPWDTVYDALGHVLAVALRQFDAGKTLFTCEGKFVGYLLRGGWRRLKEENMRRSRRIKAQHEEEFDRTEPVFVDLALVQPWAAATPRISRGSMDLHEEFQTRLWTKLWENLSDAVAAGELQFRDVAVYKHYMLHKYAIVAAGQEDTSYTIARMAAETDFSVKQINSALKVAKAYVAEYVAKLKRHGDMSCEDEAEDIFGY